PRGRAPRTSPRRSGSTADHLQTAIRSGGHSVVGRSWTTGIVIGVTHGLGEAGDPVDGHGLASAGGRGGGPAGALLTRTGRVGTARRPGPGKQDEKVQRAVNQWWNPRKPETPAPTWWIWGGQQRATALLAGGRLHDGVVPADGGGHGGGCGVPVARLPGKSWDRPRHRSMVNVGTLPGSPDPPAGQAGGGQARRQPRVWAGGGVPVVVRGRESRPHGEGGQRVRSGGTGMSGGHR